MSVRNHALLTALVLFALLLALFQCWYVYLPYEQATRFDLCRISPAIDCFESLHRYGESLRAFGVPVFPALAALFFFQALLAAFAWNATPEARRGWLTVAQLVWFPAAGLAIYVLLYDRLVEKSTSTSASAWLVAATALAGCVLTIMAGLAGRLRGPRPAVLGSLSFGAAALLFGFFLFGAGSARLEYAHVVREREAARPELSYPRFATGMPRSGAATAGADEAPCELLLFVDLTTEGGLALARDAWARATASGGKARLVVYASGELGAGLAAARDVDGFLAAPKAAPLRDPALTDPAEWKRRAGVEVLPTILWRGGKRTGSISLDEVFRAACGD